MEQFVLHYGYLAIFLLVFFESIGWPNPVSNELTLVFSGSLAYSHMLSLPLILLSAIAGDILGTLVIYFLFYYFGIKILSISWLPVALKTTIQRLTEKAKTKSNWGIFAARFIPFIRGYVSVVAGLLRIKPRLFLLQVFVSAILWTGGYILLGRFLGRYWMKADSIIHRIAIGGLILLIGLSILYAIRYFVRKKM